MDRDVKAEGQDRQYLQGNHLFIRPTRSLQRSGDHTVAKPSVKEPPNGLGYLTE